jgi:hypothetical protein
VNRWDYLGLEQLPGPPEHPDNFGEIVPDSEYPEDESDEGCDTSCRCEEAVAHGSPTKKSNRARPSGPAGIGGPCKVGTIVTLKYKGICLPEESCKGQACSMYIQWTCQKSKQKSVYRWSKEKGIYFDRADLTEWIPTKGLKGSKCK